MTDILIISDGYPSKGLPYSAFIATLAEEMTRQGMRVHVISPQSLTKHWLRGVPLAPRHFTQEAEGRTIEVYRPYSITAGDGRLGFITRGFNRLVATCTAKRLQRPDIVYAHFWLNAAMAIPYIKATKLPLVVATGEDVIPAGQISSSDKEWLKANVKAVICVSTKNRNESVSLGLADEKRCSVIPNAYSPNVFYKEDTTSIRKELGLKNDDFVVAFCGRFNERKGVFRLDAALKQLNNPHIKAIYIGSPMDNNTVVPDYTGIAFMGPLPHNEIVHYLNAADVFVLPSLAEGCPNSVIEAMACGLPVISSDLPFNEDILNSNSSILIEPQNIDAIADAIQLLFLDTTMRQQLAKESLSKAKSLRIENRTKKILSIMQT